MSIDPTLKERVADKYARAAVKAASGERADCCAGSTGDTSCCDPVTSDLYSASESQGLPEAAIRASLGCGNPSALADLRPGEVVLDLGSGAGIDVLLTAKRVGPSGMVYGLDMTNEMIALARENQQESGLTNVEFLKGEIEDIPLPDDTVDVIISNCVINLSGDKRKALAEAFRVLKPGGRFAVSDIVVRGPVPSDVRRSVELWIGCVAGALDEEDFERLLVEVGFENPTIEPTRVYGIEDARGMLERAGLDADTIAPQVGGRFMSAFVRAVKPVR